MSDNRLEIIRNLKLAAIQRCEKRIADAANPGKIREIPQFGISSHIKRRHGL